MGLCNNTAGLWEGPALGYTPVMTTDDIPPALREKFNPDGTPQPFAGNTIICHIDPASELFAALLEVHGQLGKRSFSQNLSLLPVPSYHMTVFGGANDKHRRPGAWPEGIAFDATMAECHAEIQRRLEGFALGYDMPLRMVMSPGEVKDMDQTLRLELEPLDEAENRKLRSLRDRLSETIGIRVPGHETYGFHISLAYLIGSLTAAESEDYKRSYAEWRDIIALRSPVIELGRPEFCLFKDMMRFERQFYLG